MYTDNISVNTIVFFLKNMLLLIRGNNMFRKKDNTKEIVKEEKQTKNKLKKNALYVKGLRLQKKFKTFEN